MEKIITATGTEASITIMGLWGRKRKPQVDTLKLCDDLQDGMDLQALVDAKLLEIGAKPGCKYSVFLYPWEQGKYDDNGAEYRTVKLSIGQRPILRGEFLGK